MNDKLPLLIFPQAREVAPPRGKGFPPSKQQLPAHGRQVERLETQMDKVEDDFRRFRSVMSNTLAVGEPELVLVFELASRVDDLKRAVEAAGLEWLCEWDADVTTDDDFLADGSKTKRDGRLFVSMVNKRGMAELLSIWEKWKITRKLPRGKTKWRDVFDCLKSIRRWGMKDTLIDTGMKKYFENLSDEDTANFQIECFYHQNKYKRNEVESNVRQSVIDAGGEVIDKFIEIPDIAFHAAKASMSVNKIKALLVEQDEQTKRVSLFDFPPIMYFRQTGQSITSSVEGDGQETKYIKTQADQLPVAAILDGVPNIMHEALKNRIDLDDPFGLINKYQPGERLHGTAMASLIIHGDLSDESAAPIRSRVHHVAVMQPNEKPDAEGKREEHFPIDCFYEDRIERAVRLIVVGDGEVEAQAPTVKIINLSLGDMTRPFIHTPSPWARLIDWLSWKYNVLFCVSAGNYFSPYGFGMSCSEYQSKSEEEQAQILLDTMQKSIQDRRLLAPAESINALTVGALHHDEAGSNYYLGQRVDLLPSSLLLSPISRLGHGFRGSVKPEIYFPGGRQLYGSSFNGNSSFNIHKGTGEPGQKVARDSTKQGVLSNHVFTQGTSNATALATRAGVQIYEILCKLHDQNNKPIPDSAIAVLIKTLLVHGSMQDRVAKKALENLKNARNSRKFKEVLARYLGYGAVDIERVLGCTNQRGTVIGHGEISENQMHEYRFPIPGGFSGQKTFRRMLITLAWISPINPRHRYLREAKLEIKSARKWAETPLRVERTDGEYNQVKRGTVQHEILEGKSQLEQFQQDEEIVLQVICKKDATENLEDQIPYGIAVTLEAAAETSIPVYTKIRVRLSQQIAITGP